MTWSKLIVNLTGFRITIVTYLWLAPTWSQTAKFREKSDLTFVIVSGKELDAEACGRWSINLWAIGPVPGFVCGVDIIR